jgi:hypothetical protein
MNMASLTQIAYITKGLAARFLDLLTVSAIIIRRTGWLSGVAAIGLASGTAAFAQEQCKGVGTIRDYAPSETSVISYVSAVGPYGGARPYPEFAPGYAKYPVSARPYASNPGTRAVTIYPRTTTTFDHKIYKPGVNEPQHLQVPLWEIWSTPCIQAGLLKYDYYVLAADPCAALFGRNGSFSATKPDGTYPPYATDRTLLNGLYSNQVRYVAGSYYPGAYPYGYDINGYQVQLAQVIPLDSKFAVCSVGFNYYQANSSTLIKKPTGYLVLADKATTRLKIGALGLGASTPSNPQPLFDKKLVSAWSDYSSTQAPITFNASFFDCTDNFLSSGCGAFNAPSQTKLSHSLKKDGTMRATGHQDPYAQRVLSWGVDNGNPLSNYPKVSTYLGGFGGTVSAPNATPITWADVDNFGFDKYNMIGGWSPMSVAGQSGTAEGGPNDIADPFTFLGVSASSVCIYVGGQGTRGFVRQLLTKAGCSVTNQIQFDGGGSSALSVRDINGTRYDLFKSQQTLPVFGPVERAVPVVLYAQ